LGYPSWLTLTAVALRILDTCVDGLTVPAISPLYKKKCQILIADTPSLLNLRGEVALDTFISDTTYAFGPETGKATARIENLYFFENVGKWTIDLL
jgi:hypothetical protein